jgi:hypothetical protein
MAGAPPKKPKKPRPAIFVTLGASGQVTGNTSTQTLTFIYNVETATVTGPMTLGHGPRIDGGVGVQLAKRVSLGGHLSYFQGTGQTEATFSIPNPLFFNANRTASGTGPAHRSSLDMDIEFAIALAAGKSWRLEVLVGPTITYLSQQLAVDSLTFVEMGYPYDTIVLQPSGTSAGHSGFGFGVEAGSRLTHQFNRRTGVMMDVRWRYGVSRPDVDGTPQHLVATGVQIGGGLKFVF